MSVFEFDNGLSSGFVSVSLAEVSAITVLVLVEAYTVVSGKASTLAVCPDCVAFTVFVPSTTTRLASASTATSFQVQAKVAVPLTVPLTDTFLFPEL